MRIIAYTYEAAMHCPTCTRKRFGWGAFVAAVGERVKRDGKADEHGIALEALDNENNPMRPIFITDELGEEQDNCADCKESFK
jgi:hypothetical protein